MLIVSILFAILLNLEYNGAEFSLNCKSQPSDYDEMRWTESSRSCQDKINVISRLNIAGYVSLVISR